ncbi:hypothetical protein N9C10_03030 [Flavobacteriaceae bacterium]|nr:hypothetical protein [Flavobacteriaceae bacterium]
MEGNFLSRYYKKLNEWEQLMITDSPNMKIYENEMTQYMLNCVPYIKQYANNGTDETEKHRIENIFTSGTKKVGIQKKQILNEYMYHVENDKSVSTSKPSKRSLTLETQCTLCKSFNTFIDPKESDQICMDCGIAQPTQIEGLMSYKEEQEHEKVFNYFYKRENHFNEWLNQFQARETTNIPDEIIDQLRVEFKKTKIKKLDEITHARVKSILKKLKHNKYYEHVPYIANLLNGIKPPRMTQELEDKLRKMFNDIQAPFDKHCPEERKNFLSYSYVLYKFCELLSEDEYLPCFPLLKAKDKLYQQDVIWKKICNELEWEFIPTI